MGSKVLILGEAPGQEEILAGMPFVGSAGQELARMLRDVGLPTVMRETRGGHRILDIDREFFACDNVFTTQPAANDIERWCVAKDEAVLRYKVQRPELLVRYPNFPWPETYNWTALTQKGYLDPLYLSHLPRLAARIAAINPNLIISLGNTPLWALTNTKGIAAARGVMGISTRLGEWKFLPTYHPSAVLRNYSFRTVALIDLQKAKAQMGSADLEHKAYDLIIEPTREELLDFIAGIQPSDELSTDIETSRGLVTCIGFAHARESINIPITRLDYSLYWGDATPWALDQIQHVLNLPNPKVFQNGLYDLQYIWRVLGMTVKNFHDDTMLLHHTLQPEMPKSLAFLASVYTQASTWKGLSKLAKFKVSEGKKDD